MLNKRNPIAKKKIEFNDDRIFSNVTRSFKNYMNHCSAPASSTTERPTDEEMAQLERGTYIEYVDTNNGRKHACVHADRINEKRFEFTCPFCYSSRYNEHSEPRANAKRMIHSHGSSNERFERIEVWDVRCKRANAQIDQFLIYITSSTNGSTT